jgi:hypothetical protein
VCLLVSNPVMLKEFLFPFVTLTSTMLLSVIFLDQLCQFYRIFQATASKLHSERWLVEQCEDAHFFSKMHIHTDICFTVENNARIGVFMLSLQEFTRSILSCDLVAKVLGGWTHRLLFSWQAFLGLCLFLCFAPSWIFSGVRSLKYSSCVGQRRWPECMDGHFKDA